MDLMRESPFAQYLTQQAREEGIEQGERKHAIEAWILCRRAVYHPAHYHFALAA